MAQYSDELKHLKSFIPKLISLRGLPNLNQRQLVVHFPDVNTSKYPACQKALELFCWPTNAKQQRWVRDPVVEGGPDRGKVSGLWRFVSADCDKTKYSGLMVTLREGYASTLMWDEAMLSNADWLQESERYADIVFPNIDPEKVQTIVDGIADHTEVDFKVRNHTYTATAESPWEYLRAKPEQQDDGSYVIRLFAAQPRYTQTLYDNYGTPEQSTKTVCHNVPKRLAESVVTTYNLVEGASGTSNYSTEQGTVDLIFYQRSTTHVTIRNLRTYDGCEYVEDSDYWYNYTKAQAEAFTLASVYGDYAQGHEYAIEGVSYAGGGRYTIRTTHREVKSATDITNQVWENSADATTILTRKRGQTSLPSPAKGSGFYEWLRATKDRFCTWTTELFRKTSNAWSVNFTITNAHGYSEGHYLAGNQRSVNLPSVNSTEALRLSSFSRNASDGTYNWHVAKVPRLATISGSYTVARDKVIYAANLSYVGVTPVLYLRRARRTKTVQVQEFANVNAAIAWAGSLNTMQKPWDVISPNRILGFKEGEETVVWTEGWQEEDDIPISSLIA